MRPSCTRLALLALAAMTEVSQAANEIKLYAWVAGETRPTTATASSNSGADIADNTVTIIQLIADSPTTNSIGHVTLRRDGSQTTRLRLMVAGSSISNLFMDPDQSMPAGCLNWAGVHALDIGDAADTPGQDTATGHALVVAAAINGDFAQGSSADGRIEAGHIHHLESQPAQSGGGSLNIPVWGYGQGYGGDQSDLHTIGMIDMSNSVAATVRADNTSNVTPSDYQDIFRIRVGPGEFSAGISGRISCPKGYIAQITSTGPISISTTGTEAGIQAGSRIDYIYAGEETGNPTQLPTNVRDISAKIVCRKLNLNGSISAGVLRRLHTAGDLTQPVDVVSINAPTDNATCAHNYGILVGGTITQPINVDRVLYLAVISAADFAPGADVTIGRYVKGTIEATATNGNLRAVSIGRGSETFPSYHGMNGWDGVCGTDTDADPPLHHSRQDDQVR